MSTFQLQDHRIKSSLKSAFIPINPGNSAKAKKWGLLHWLELWINRKQLREMIADRPDYLLEDIGLTREQVEKEARLPFWKPGIYF